MDSLDFDLSKQTENTFMKWKVFEHNILGELKEFFKCDNDRTVIQ